MKAFLFKDKDIKKIETKKIARKKWLAIIMVCLFSLSIFSASIKPVYAQGAPVLDISNLAQAIKNFFETKIGKIIKKAGSIAFNRTLATSLNKIAYDAANYIGSGGEGQKELFVKEDLKTYISKIGDEAAGQFLETFVNNLDAKDEGTCSEKMSKCYEACYRITFPSAEGVIEQSLLDFFAQDALQGDKSRPQYACIDQCQKGATNCASGGAYGLSNRAIDTGLDAASFNVCQPSSIEVKLKISLGLVDQTRPQGPNCTATEIVNNWGDDFEKKWEAIQSGDYLNNVSSIFDPRGNDLGIYFLARSDIAANAEYKKSIKKTEVTESGGWIDVRNIAGDLKGVPNAAQKAEADARAIRIQNFGKTTGDILVDASNIFLNQLAISAYNNLMRKLAEKKDSASLTEYAADPNVSYGVSSMKEKTRILIEPKFDIKSDYDVLAKLASCLNPSNPAPDNCVIDDGFMQAITEKKTVAEAMEEGLLHANWRIEKEVVSGAFNSHYSLRNVKILRKYRILPLGWEVAIENAFASSSNVQRATLSDLISCYDQNDEYTEFSSSFNTKNVAWCQGMVDPNWVLKAPLNYCKKEGPGPYINSTIVVPGVKGINGVPDILSSVTLSRADDYCADNQSCIKENPDGSCDLYGYCNEEKRTWRFDSETCSPISNTCQFFTNSSNGQSTAYLKNTLDYGNCNIDNAGCTSYSLSGLYAGGSVAWDPAKTIYLNNNLKSCSNSSEGCSQYLRVKPTWGANLLRDGGFIEEALGTVSADGQLGSWSISGGDASVVDMGVNFSDQNHDTAVKISGTNPVRLSTSRESFPENLQIIAKQNYTLSADIYIVSADRVELTLDPAGANISKSVNIKDAWQSLSITASSEENLMNAALSITGYGSDITFYVKNIKFELGDWATSFSSYGSFKVNQKVLPAYLESSCYTDVASAKKDYRLKSGAPTVCSNYARKCNQDEVGCQLFTGVYDRLSVPAKVSSSDYCPNECVDYNVYIAKESTFHSTKAENLIPRLSQSCSQEAVGCSEFTNLDEVAAGGEGKEYYVRLRQCIKPDTNKCANFYTWEYGNQITWQSLQKDSNGEPLVNFGEDDSACSEEIYNLPISDPEYNPDCRRYTSASGKISYRSASRVITCSDNCHSYRLSGKNIDQSIKSASACSDVDGIWNADNSCTVCKNGGTWDSGQGACLYQAIPNEGKTCSASESSCREYNGSFGNNVRLVSAYNFNGGFDGWSSNCSDGLTSSPISSFEGAKSIYYNAAAVACDVSDISRKSIIERVFAADSKNVMKVNTYYAFTSGRAYTIRFMARAENDAALNIFFRNEDTKEKSYFLASGDLSTENNPLVIKGGNEWRVYNVNLSSLDFNNNPEISLNISSNSSDQSFWIDDIVVNEISNRYYLIENSSDVPNVCYYDNLGNYQGADYNLGCSQYRDNDNLQHSLHNFSSLCQDSSVGCEQMIDTKNYKPSGSGIWNDTNDNGTCDVNEKDCVTVDRDSALYVVYDKTKNCLQADLGCSRLGQGLGTGLDISWSDVYKLNNPDNYHRILCDAEDVGCEEYKDNTNGSVSYFKNPGNNVCTYRESKDPSITGKAWYKVAVKRCDKNNDGTINGDERSADICSSDADCGISTCILDSNDYNCSVSYLKTIGLGGLGGTIPVPDKSVGLCDAAYSGCTEYIDPVSRFNSNLVHNSSYTPDPNNNNKPSAWGEDKWPNALGALVPVFSDEQVLELDRNKLYVFTAKNNSSGAYVAGPSLSFVRDIRVLDANNNISTTSNRRLLTLSTDAQPIIFHSMDNYSTKIKGGNSSINIEVRELAISYNMSSGVDKSSCAGITNFDNGCVLFNERSVIGASGFNKNVFNADATADGETAVVNVGPYTANQLIKVRPDRICAKWLTCSSYGTDEASGQSFCYSMAECSVLDDKNECASVITYAENQPVAFDPTKDKNASGYAIANQYYFNNIKEVGLNSEAHYDFEDTVPALNCVKKSGLSPMLAPFGGVDNNCVFDESIVKDSIIREPLGSPTDYPAQGRQYLQVGDSQFISPQSRSSYFVLPKKGTYYINFLVNTKGSQSSAKVIVYEIGGIDTNGNVSSASTSLNTIVTSKQNWERKVFSFGTSKDNAKIQIYLGTDGPASGGSAVYFDDINIEPALETAKGEFTARDCRLYPTSESLSCYDKDNTVIRNGLEGYCLEYDLANPKVCQLWYPVDKISSSRLISSKAGYNGKYPLNYCTEVNTDFTLLERRKAAIVRHDQIRRDSKDFLGVRECYYPAGTWASYCNTYFRDLGSGDKISSQPSSGTTNSNVVVTQTDDGTTWTLDSGAEVEDPVDLIEAITDDPKIIDVTDDSEVAKYCGSSGNYFLLFIQDLKQENTSWFKRDDVARTWICIPFNSQSSAPHKRYVSDLGEPITTFDGTHKILPFTDGWYLADGFDNSEAKVGDGDTVPEGFNEAFNADPPIRVLDKNEGIPAGVDGLKKISSTDADEVFSLTCNKFVETVSSSGDNKAWTYRVGKDSPYTSNSTSTLFQVINGVDYRSYVRNLGDIPFGAASWPDDFNLIGSPRVSLNNQYSLKMNKDVFAGRPYGCDASSDDKSKNCQRVGYCSANPDVYCLIDDNLFGDSSAFYLAKQSCGSFGTCLPLWNISDHKNILIKDQLKNGATYTGPLESNRILSKLFLQAPVAYQFGAKGYQSTVGYFSSSDSGISPRIDVLGLYYGNSTAKVVTGSGIKKGSYRLEFTTGIDKDHQPLKQLMIDWGDGYNQVITDQDSRPAMNNPHVFYHYYSADRGNLSITIKAYDNWGVESTKVQGF